MTAIAAFEIDGCPIIFGDLLITGPTGTKKSVGLPAIGDAHQVFGDSGWSILGLQQKVVIINDRCALAWAGSYIAAKVAIEEIRDLGTRIDLTADGIRAFLAGQPDVAQHGVSFVGWVLEKDTGRFAQFRHDAEVIHTTALGRVALEGSGAFAIKEFISLFDKNNTKETGSVDVKTRAVSIGLSMASMLLRAELHGGANAPTLLTQFGGGYEIATFSNGAFRKIGDITHLFWNAKVTKQGVGISFPLMIVKQAYLNDALVLRSARTKMENENIMITDEQAHLITPMYGINAIATEADVLAVPYNSRLLSHCVFVTDEDSSELALHTRLQYTSSPSKPTIQIEDNEGKLNFIVSQEFLKDLCNSVKSTLNRSK